MTASQPDAVCPGHRSVTEVTPSTYGSGSLEFGSPKRTLYSCHKRLLSRDIGYINE
jgi:hypothetical protein